MHKFCRVSSAVADIAFVSTTARKINIGRPIETNTIITGSNRVLIVPIYRPMLSRIDVIGADCMPGACVLFGCARQWRTMVAGCEIEW
jgi:hypothetical protein